jgi:lipopolysaccharide transport system permease protein
VTRAALARSADVLRALALADARVRYGRSRARAVRWLLDPYAVTGVYLVLVTIVLDRQGRAVGLSIACALVPFQLIVMTIVNALTAVQSRRSVITNMRFDRQLIPVASVVTESVGFAATLTLLGVMMAVYGVAPTPAVLWLPVLVAATMLVALAAAYPAALIGIWFREATPFVLSGVRAAFFIAPGFVALAEVRGGAGDWLRANPLTGLFESYRSVFLYGDSPAAWELLVPSAIAAATLAVLVPLFRREAPQLARLVE